MVTVSTVVVSFMRIDSFASVPIIAEGSGAWAVGTTTRVEPGKNDGYRQRNADLIQQIAKESQLERHDGCEVSNSRRWVREGKREHDAWYVDVTFEG